MAALCWTNEQDALLRKLWRERELSLEQIASRLGVARSSIQRRASALGLPTHQRPKGFTAEERRRVLELRAAQYSTREIGRLLGRPNRTIGRLLAREAASVSEGVRRPWTEDEISSLHAMWEDGQPNLVNASRAAEALGRPRQSVMSRAKAEGLISRNTKDPYRPTPEEVMRHAEACLAQGGFPVSVATPQGPVWIYPARQEAVAA